MMEKALEVKYDRRQFREGRSGIVPAHTPAHGDRIAPFNKPHSPVNTVFSMAEDGGFEPPRAFTQHAFQACAIGH